MKRAALYSGLLHVIVFLILMIGIPNPFEKKLTELKPMMVEFVDISELSTAPVLAPESVSEPEPTPPEPELKPEPTPPEPTPPEPTPPEPTPPEPTPPQPEPIPEPTPPEPEVKPEPDVVPIPEDKPKKDPPKEEKKKDPPKPKEEKAVVNLDKKDPKPKTDTKEKPDKKKVEKAFDDLLNELEKTDKKDKSKSSSAIKGAPADRIGPTMTGTEIDAVRRTIARCWNVNPGALGAKDLRVELDMKLRPDGTVESAKITDMKRYRSDPAFRAAADGARQAVLDPNCNPLPLSPKKYDQWKDLTMSFDPKNMF